MCVCTEARWMFSSFFFALQIPHMVRHSRAYFQFTDNSMLIRRNFVVSNHRMIETLENCKESNAWRYSFVSIISSLQPFAFSMRFTIIISCTKLFFDKLLGKNMYFVRLIVRSMAHIVCLFAFDLIPHNAHTCKCSLQSIYHHQ